MGEIVGEISGCPTRPNNAEFSRIFAVDGGKLSANRYRGTRARAEPRLRRNRRLDINRAERGRSEKCKGSILQEKSRTSGIEGNEEEKGRRRSRGWREGAGLG